KLLILSLAPALAFLAGCGSGSDPASNTPPPAAFAMAASPGSRSADQGSSASYTITLTSQNGFSSPVTPTVSGLPARASASFNPATITPTASGASTTMMVTLGSAGSPPPTPAGTYTLTVSATSGTIVRQTGLSVVVTAPPAPGSLSGNIH